MIGGGAQMCPSKASKAFCFSLETQGRYGIVSTLEDVSLE